MATIELQVSQGEGSDESQNGVKTLKPEPEELLSNFPILKRVHYKAGYREGYTYARHHSLQLGFDPGYELGMRIGGRVAWVIGALEGYHEATKQPYRMGGALCARHHDEEYQASGLLAKAREELDLEKVFAELQEEDEGQVAMHHDGGSAVKVKSEGEIAEKVKSFEKGVLAKWVEEADLTLDERSSRLLCKCEHYHSDKSE